MGELLGMRKEEGEVVKGMNVEGVDEGKGVVVSNGEGLLGRRKEER